MPGPVQGPHCRWRDAGALTAARARRRTSSGGGSGPANGSLAALSSGALAAEDLVRGRAVQAWLLRDAVSPAESVAAKRGLHAEQREDLLAWHHAAEPGRPITENLLDPRLVDDMPEIRVFPVQPVCPREIPTVSHHRDDPAGWGLAPRGDGERIRGCGNIHADSRGMGAVVGRPCELEEGHRAQAGIDLEHEFEMDPVSHPCAISLREGVFRRKVVDQRICADSTEDVVHHDAVPEREAVAHEEDISDIVQRHSRAVVA